MAAPLARIVLLVGVVVLGCSSCRESTPASGGAAAKIEDEVEFSFVVVGCNQVGWPASREGRLLIGSSTANEPQLEQTLRDVAALPRRPEYFFLVGDLVRNETSGEVLAGQLEAWQRLWSASPLAASAVRLVPIPGNHELNRAVQSSAENWYEVPDPDAAAVWRTWVDSRGGPHPTDTGPTVASHGADLLVGSGGSLSWWFDAEDARGGSIRFVVLDTDSRSTAMPPDECLQEPPDAVEFEGRRVPGTRGLMVPGWTPVSWLDETLEASETSSRIFVLGHKPILWPEDADPASFDSDGNGSIFNCGEHRLAASMCELLGERESIVAYLCAHRHRWSYATIAGGVRQLIAGNGGSLLDEGVPQEFGFTVIELWRSGRVTATSWTRPAPTPIDLREGVRAAKPNPPVEIRAANG